MIFERSVTYGFSLIAVFGVLAIAWALYSRDWYQLCENVLFLAWNILFVVRMAAKVWPR